jgi:hypothetical protein
VCLYAITSYKLHYACVSCRVSFKRRADPERERVAGTDADHQAATLRTMKARDHAFTVRASTDILQQGRELHAPATFRGR